MPAFLTDDWHQRYLGTSATVPARYLRRAAAIALVQLAEACTIAQAAAMLHVPTEAAYTAHESVHQWAVHGYRFQTAIHNLASELATQPEKVNYGRRRQALVAWSIEPADWRSIVDQLHAASSSTQRRLTLWDERKRNTASALVWVRATQGEHLFAPHRYSPNARPGSTQDLGLAIDRAWWRARQPGRHYARLMTECAGFADRLTARIDAAVPPSAHRRR